MRRLVIVILLWTMGAWFAVSARAETYALLNGSAVAGEPIFFDSSGLVIRPGDGGPAQRIAWTNFTQTALKQLANNPKARRFVEPLIEEEEEESPRMAAPELTPKPVEHRLARPDPKAGFGAVFTSPVSTLVFLVVYLANLYASYQVSYYRKYPVAHVCGVAAVAPVIGPIVFLCLPKRTVIAHEATAPMSAADAPVYADPEFAVAEAPGVIGEGAAPASAPAATAPPPPTIYKRGQTTFNRRFFETKLAGFLRMVPSDAERDMLVCVSSARGNFVGQRISKIMPNELFLQVHKGGASSDVIIPYSEISEIQIRHKDT